MEKMQQTGLPSALENIAKKEAGMNRKDWVKIVIMPLIIVLLPAGVGGSIGVYLQDRSFRKNELFKTKLELIMASQKEAIEILKDVDRARRQIRANEDFIKGHLQRLQSTNPEQVREAKKYYCEGNFMASSIAILKEPKIRTLAIEDYTKSSPNRSAVSAAIQNFSQELAAIIRCLEKEDCTPCSDTHEQVVASFREVITAHVQMATTLVEEYE